MIVKFTIRCPRCSREQHKPFHWSVPRNTVDCRCGAHAEIKPINRNANFAFWSVDWFWDEFAFEDTPVETVIVGRHVGGGR